MTNKNTITAVGFAISFLILLGWMFSVVMTVESSPQVRLVITGYDPRDLLSGHYIAYSINWANSDCTQFTNNTCPKDRFSWQERFYIPEKDAPELDRRYRESWRRGSSDVFEVIYAFPETGQPIARQLLINGKDWRESR